jgi:ferredoxin-NADP reductase
MKNYRVSDISRTTSHLALTLSPHYDEDRIEHWAGQYAAISFKNNGRRSPVRCFSIVSSPTSRNLQFAMRISGKFTNKLAGLQIGDDIYVQGPFGDFVLDPADQAIVMLAAGIGITPFMSMLRYAADTKSKLPITLVYANSTEDDIPFYDELRSLQAQNYNIRVIFAVSNGANDPGRSIYGGRIDENLIRRVVGGRFKPYTFFLCGPPNFTKDMHIILQNNGVHSDSIITESFTQSYGVNWNVNKLSIPHVTYALTGLTFLAGFAAIMAIDLILYVPKVSANSGSTSTNSSAAITPSSNSSNGNSSTPTSSSANNSSTSNNTNTQPTTN